MIWNECRRGDCLEQGSRRDGIDAGMIITFPCTWSTASIKMLSYVVLHYLLNDFMVIYIHNVSWSYWPHKSSNFIYEASVHLTFCIRIQPHEAFIRLYVHQLFRLSTLFRILWWIRLSRKQNVYVLKEISWYSVKSLIWDEYVSLNSRYYDETCLWPMVIAIKCNGSDWPYLMYYDFRNTMVLTY